jgi:hypothetical protein
VSPILILILRSWPPAVEPLVNVVQLGGSNTSNMTGTIQIAWLLATMLGAVFGTPLVGVEPPPNRALTRPRMPNNDEWYRPEKGFDKHAPGTILKYRPVPRGLSINNKDSMDIKGWQILYRTSDSMGEPDATVVTVLVPQNAIKKNLLLYHWFSVSQSKF